MLYKLAILNVKRSFKDYLIYIITVTLAFSLVFAFNFISFSEDILELSEVMENFKYAIIFVSLVIIFVVGWLINYTMRFMFMKRSKEFGIYMLLGIEKKDITKMFLLENLLLGLFAFICSIFIGIIFSNFLSAIIMNIFELPYEIELYVNISAILLSALYFAIIYLFALLRSKHRIKKMKIYNLLYLDKTNEKRLFKHRKLKSFLFIIFVILGIAGLLAFDYTFKNTENSGMIIYLLVAFILLAVSIYGLTFTVTDFILAVVLKRKKIKYQKDNLFVFRNLYSKVKTMGMTMGTLSLLITLTLISSNVSFMMKDAFQHQINSSIPYDIIIDNIYSEVSDGATGPMDFRDKLDDYLAYIHDHYTVQDEFSYNIYTEKSTEIYDEIDDLGVTGYIPFDAYIKVSDYNKLLEMLGREQITLEDDEYYIHGNQDLRKRLEKAVKNKPVITVNNYKLQAKGFTNKDFVTGWGTGSSYFIIIPDKVAEGLKILNQIVSINTKEETTEEFYYQISEDVGKLVLEGNYEGETYFYEIDALKVKGDFLAQNRSALTMFSFSLIYLSFIFTAVVGTIIAIGTLSDSAKYKYRYNVLRNLGVNENELNKTILKQVSFNFLLPLIFPIIITICTAISLNRLLGPVMTSEYSYIYTTLFSFALFILIYMVYFVATYFGFKKNTYETF